ncbi:MAG TPA: PorV/PorQ family protein [Ignavibacteriaceae bacterium]|nr:PorV/PorQ family protein [Ignavibacteriaceae bacterium]
MRNAILLFIFLTVSVFPQNPNLGTSGAKFLSLSLSPRAEALGSAVVGLSDDAASVFYNPAGIVKVKNVEAFFSYSNWFNMFDLNAASIVYNAGDYGTFAASMILFTTGKMEVTTEEKPNGTGRYFDAGDVAVGITYAKYLTDRFNVGITAKYIRQQIWNEYANGFAFDIGTQYRIDFQNLTIAMSMSNFGGDMSFDGPDLDLVHLKNNNYPLSRLTPARYKTDEYPLPLNFQVGIGFDIFEYDFIKARGGIDASHPNDNNERVHTGLEIKFFDRFFVRGGYRYNYDDQKFSFGAGANVPFGDSFVSFDYAYSVYDLLPNVNRIALSIMF